ncbi:MAG: IS66 family transposase [Paraglaciecola sp.]
MITCADLLTPLYDRLHELILSQPVIAADETTLKVVSENKAKCYMWVYISGADSSEGALPNTDIPNTVLYDYQSNCAGQCAGDYLQGYSSYLQVDGYAGYQKTQDTLAGRWAHARRKFVEAKIVQGKQSSGRADWAMNHIQKLYRIETQIKASTTEEQQPIKQEKSTILLKQSEAWLVKSEPQVLAKSKLSEAITYSLNQWDKLNKYTQNGQLSIDDYRAERAIKPFVIGRKNWLFSQTAKGAKASAILYSIIETSKANGLTPFDYMRHLLEHITYTG